MKSAMMYTNFTTHLDIMRNLKYTASRTLAHAYILNTGSYNPSTPTITEFMDIYGDKLEIVFNNQFNNKLKTLIAFVAKNIDKRPDITYGRIVKDVIDLETSMELHTVLARNSGRIRALAAEAAFKQAEYFNKQNRIQHENPMDDTPDELAVVFSSQVANFLKYLQCSIDNSGHMPELTRTGTIDILQILFTLCVDSRQYIAYDPRTELSIEPTPVSDYAQMLQEHGKSNDSGYTSLNFRDLDYQSILMFDNPEMLLAGLVRSNREDSALLIELAKSPMIQRACELHCIREHTHDGVANAHN